MHRMASILFLCLAASLTAAGQEALSKSAAGQSAQAQKDAPAVDESVSGGQYINRTAKLSLTLPADWVIDTNLRHSPTMLARLSTRDKLSWIGVTREQDSGPLESYKEVFELKVRRDLTNYEKLSESFVTIDGKAALLISFRATAPNNIALRATAPNNSNSHVVYLAALVASGNTYTTVRAWCAEPRFHDMRPIFEDILASYHSIGQPSATTVFPPITSPLTAKQIQSLQSSTNDPGGDYFIASHEDQKNIVSAFVEDNSKSDPTYLYLAANTAYRIGELKEAAFLFYAAQIRKAFDYKRYGLGKANGDNIQTYWGFLNQALGESLNTAITRSPREFSEVVDMLGKWQVVPADDALYVKTMYGAYVLPKSQWQATADSIKKDFMDNYGYKLKQFLSNPENAEALAFVHDYNFNQIPHTPENDRKFQKYRDIVNKGLSQ